MKLAPILLSVAALFSFGSAGRAAETAPERPIAFARSGAVWIAREDGSHAERLTAGTDPALSPDGRTIAFTNDHSSGSSVRRSIGAIDLASRQVREVVKVASDNAFGPAWSPDGEELLFSLFADGAWHVALVDAAGGEPRVLRKGEPGGHACYSPAFAADGASFFCQDLDEVFQLGLDGGERWRAKAAQLFGSASLNSGARLAPSPDGKSVLIDVDLDEETDLRGWDGPPPAIYAIDLGAKTARRISPPKRLVWQPAWLSSHSILCVTQDKGDRSPGVARMALDGTAPVRLIANGRWPSTSRPAAP
jgi:TolB protein